MRRLRALMDWQAVGLRSLLCLLLLPCCARAQSAEIEHLKRCTAFLKRSNEAYDNITGNIQRNENTIESDWDTLLSASRAYLAECSDESGPKGLQARLLSDIAEGLIHREQYEDAIPVLRRCTAMDPDSAFCWERLGVASEGLHRRFDAKASWRKAIEIGGFTERNARAVKRARVSLARLEELETTLGDQLPFDPSAPKSTGSAPDTSASTHTFGTGFFISAEGIILTNDHVVAGCRSLATRDGKHLQVLSRAATSDLALLKADFAPASVAIFRLGPSPKIGDAVVAFGFPLPGILSSGGNVTTGVLSAASGVQNDPRFVQISAPVQPGNSGGPLFDSSGHVIGVVVAKLDALRVARATGDLPQNVNFAVHWAHVRAFLDEEGIRYRKELSKRTASTGDTAAMAVRISVSLDCTK